jgi:hypothetical protein
VLDGRDPAANDILTYSKERGAVCFVFADALDAAAEEQLMRHGAGLLLAKPINIDQLLTQASFLSMR